MIPADPGNAKKKEEVIVVFKESFRLLVMMVFMQVPEYAVHYIFMGKPCYAFHS